MELNRPKILLITGNELRHRFFAATLSQHVELVGVIYEKKANKHEKTDYGQDGNIIVANHFSLRSDSEQHYFADVPELDQSVKTIEVGTTQANNEKTFDWIQGLDIDLIQLYGSSIIKNHILEKFKNKVVNLHLGLSPYYRGSGTNFWPLVHKKVSCLGATIHLAVLEADAGGILHQVRPTIEKGDTIHDLGNKTIVESISILPKVLNKYYQKNIAPIKQDLENGILCLRKDLTPEAITTMYQNFEDNLIDQYILNKEKEISSHPIVEQV